jgi:hypothetical protein
MISDFGFRISECGPPSLRSNVGQDGPGRLERPKIGNGKCSFKFKISGMSGTTEN